ncbi:hypothetical protein [Chitinilyticum litopenaei]|uniref:hypothetical protein n=1 Tax=Chitinilyticum litopenaei TaxID=1121276 RepID=UPI0006852D5C|nr:hypothetical protein [Chitinilyticum litopenaei]
MPTAILSFVDQQTGAPRADGLLLYHLDDLIERNDTFEISQYLPGYLLIGDDSGGRGILASCEHPGHPVYICSLGSLAKNDFVLLAATLQQWQASGCPTHKSNSNASDDTIQGR